jgi:XTP/dITP diphosphohydrolase
MISLLLATRNSHKVAEIRSILGGNFRFLTLHDLPGAPAVVEDAHTFAGNATKKALELAHWLAGTRVDDHAFVLADDSGLEVDALNGAPGVHSARFAGLDGGLAGNSPDAANCSKLLRLLKSVPPEKRAARFRCVMALVPVLRQDKESASPVCFTDELELRTQLAEGACEGRIISEPRGQGGFGYDPLFVPDGYDETFAELGEAVKNQFSHRAKALAALKVALGVA